MASFRSRSASRFSGPLQDEAPDAAAPDSAANGDEPPAVAGESNHREQGRAAGETSAVVWPVAQDDGADGRASDEGGSRKARSALHEWLKGLFAQRTSFRPGPVAAAPEPAVEDAVAPQGVRPAEDLETLIAREVQTMVDARTDNVSQVPTIEPPPTTAVEAEAEAAPAPDIVIDEQPKPAPSPQPQAASLLTSIYSVAESWGGGHGWAEPHEVDAGVPTPEELVGAAGARGIDVTYAERELRSLRAADFPCVLLDKDGRSTVLLGRDGAGLFTCRAGGDTVLRTADQLQGLHGGVVFFVRPKADHLAHDTAAPREYVETKSRGLIGSILHEIRTHHRGDMIQLAVAAGASNLLLFAMPLFSMAVYDRVIPHLAMESLWALALGIMLALSVDFGLRVARLRLNDAIALTITSTLQSRYFARILSARASAIPPLGGSLQSGLREIESVAQLLPNVLVSIMIDLPFFIIATALLFALAGPVAIAPWGAALLILASQVFADLNNQRVRESTRLSTTQSNLLVETAAGRETVQTLGAAGHMLRRWEKLADATAYAGHVNRLHGNVAMIAALTISQVAYVATILIGVYQIGAGAMTIGALSASTLLIGRMMSPMTQLGSYLHRLKQVSGSVAIVEKILSAELESAADPTAPTRKIDGLIELRGVSFTYPGEKTPALSDINLVIRPGERVGIIGRAGSGKSTLMKLLVRLHDADSGAYRIDGHDARQYAPQQIRKHFAYMRQDSLPFDDTLRNVICFGLERVDEDAFRRAVTVSGVHEFASRHPSGYGMRVGPRGERLSGGERQAVMLARILLGEPPAMLLDEPTSSMDNTMEMRLVGDLRELIGERTFVVSTHRAALLGLVDRLVWIEHGRVVADGPKADVLKRMAGG